MRSRFEEKIASQLKLEGVPFKYEPYSFNYYVRVPNTVCHDCSSRETFSQKWYTPDFQLSDRVYLEAKGLFKADDRKKMIACKELHPYIEWRLVFMRDNKLSKFSTTRYSDWALQNNFKFNIARISDEWIEEFKTNGI